MSESMKRIVARTALVAFISLTLFACGGGGGGSTSPSTPVPTAGMTDANGLVTLSVSGKATTFRLLDVDGKPAAGAAVGINMDTGTTGVGVMLISDPNDKFPPKIRIVVGTGGASTPSSLSSTRLAATQGTNDPVLVQLFGKNPLVPILGGIDEAIGYLEISGISAPTLLQPVATGVSLVGPLISLASTMNTILGGRIGSTLLDLGMATKVTVTTDEFTADLQEANSLNGIKLFVMSGLTLTTLNPLTAEQAGGVVLDMGLNYYNGQIYGGCGSGTVDKIVSRGITLGYACGSTAPLPSLYGSLFDASSNGQPLASGLFQMVSKDRIGLAVTGVLDSNGSTTVKLPAGDYDVTVVPPPGSSSTLATNKASVTVNAGGSPISISNFTLSVVTSGTGSGSIASSPSGTTFASGAVVTLTATPNSDSTFTGWSGACSGTGSCVVTMDAPKTVTATFTVTQGGNDNGALSLAISSVNCSGSEKLGGGSIYCKSTVTATGTACGPVGSYLKEDINGGAAWTSSNWTGRYPWDVGGYSQITRASGNLSCTSWNMVKSVLISNSTQGTLGLILYGVYPSETTSSADFTCPPCVLF